jgi:molybdopterin molybdotransferase
VIVEKLPRISIITSGDEIVDVMEPVSSVQIRNSNSHLIKALLKKWNITPFSFTHVPDNPEKIERAIHAAAASDIIIMCGGVSAGDADYTPDTLTKLGARKIFHKVAMRPGKPIWFGKFDQQAVIFALPGNPFSCMVTFKLFIDLFLSRSFGLKEPQPIQLPLNTSRSKKTPLDEFFPVTISGTPSCIELISFNSSGDIKAALTAHGIARHPYNLSELQAGDILDCYLV